MRKISSYLVIILMSFTAISQLHAEESADLHAAIKAFNHAYTSNDVESYFNFYADDATVYVGGEVRVDMAAYHEMWIALMAAGGGVELNDMSDSQVQVLPSGDFAISTSFISNHTRSSEGALSKSRAYETNVWQKVDGQWKIVSLHYSGISEEE